MAQDACIGKLTLDISDVDKKVTEINTLLSKLGSKANVNISKQISKEVKGQLDSILKDLNKYAEEIKRSAANVSKSFENMGIKASQNKELSDTVAALRDYYNALRLVEQAKQQGNQKNEQLWSVQATEALNRVNTSLRTQAEAYQSVVKAKTQYEAAQNRTSAKAAAEETKEIEKATQSYIKMLELKSKVKQLESQGKQDSKEYLNATQAAGKAYDAFMKYSDGARKAAQASKEAAQARKDLNEVEAKVSSDSSQIDYLALAKQKYFELTDAIKRYNAESKVKNTAGMETEQAKIDAAMAEVGAIEQTVQASNMEADAKQNVLNIIQQCVTAETQHNSEVKRTSTYYGDVESQITSVMTRMFSLMAIIRGINTLIQNTVEYVSAYYDKMNEIQIITQKSDDEVENLAQTYREIAEMMNVSTLDIADSAIYFTRQGLAAEEIEQRLVNVTRYAKTANVEFKEASEIITAVVNSMGLVEQEAEDGRNATQRVADVFLKVGDSAATSGQEIGSAMQKAAASAGAFGMSFEWLASYIATVSETTRQEARTIGTALNTIIARLHQIKQNGYNSEDETKINDVQKALAKIDVALMDQNKEWRDMDTIFQEIGEKWGTLDGKTKSYIATTMAGVKQQNVFLALMNDLGKGIEGGSRAYELYAKAVDSAGTAEEKYATWTDSVAASQERLTLAQEKFYSLLDASVIKGWNDALAGMINLITAGADAWNSWNIVLPAVAAGIVTVVAAIKLMHAAANGVTTLLTKHPIVAAIAAGAAVLATLVTGLSAVAKATAQAKQNFDDANAAIKETHGNIQNAQSLQNGLAQMYEKTGGKIRLTAEDLAHYSSLLEKVSAISPEAASTVDALKGGFIDQKKAVADLNAEIDKYIGNEQKISAYNMIKKYTNYQEQNADKQGFASRYEQWDQKWFEGKTGSEGFAAALKNAYNRTKLWDFDITSLNRDGRYLTKSVYDTISEMVQYGADWKTIGARIWGEIFSGTSDYNIQDAIKSEIESMVDDVVNIASMTMDEFDAASIRKKLVGLLFDSEGNAKGDLQESAKVVAGFVADLMNYSFDASAMMTPYERVLGFAGTLIGQIPEDMYLDIFKATQNNPEIVDAIAQSYNELIAAGLSKVDIAEVLKNTPVANWGDLIGQTKDYLLGSIMDASGMEALTGGLWNDLDASTLSAINNMVKLGTSIYDIQYLMSNSESVDEFVEKLKTIGGEDEDGNMTENAEDYVAALKKITTEIDKLNRMLASIKKGETVDFEDLLNLSSAHPEIMQAIADTKSLLEAIQSVKEADMNEAIATMRNNIMNSADFAAQSIFAVGEGGTLQQYKDQSDTSTSRYVDQYVDQIIASFLASTDKLGSVGKEILAGWMNSLFSESNVDLLNRKVVEIGEDVATVLTETFTASKSGKEGLKWNADVVMNITPITPDGQVLDEETLNQYVEELLAKSSSIEDLFENDRQGKGLLISADQVTDEGFETAINNATTLAELLHMLQAAYYGVADAEKNWLELQIEQQELNEANEWAKSNGYIEQITELNNALSEGGSEGIQSALEIWNEYDQTLQKAILDTYPELGRAILDAKKAIDDTSASENDAAQASDNLGKKLDKAAKYASVKYFKDTYAAIQKLEKGTISAADAYDVFDKELDKVKKAQEDITDVNQKMSDKTEVTVSDVSNLASVLGISAEKVLADWPAAVAMFDDLTSTTGELQAAINDLNKAAFIRITGVSEADFSKIQGGLIAVQNDAKATIAMLQATGQWELETVDLPAEMPIFSVGPDGSVTQTNVGAVGSQTILRPTGSNQFNIGGGGGSSNNKKKGGGGGGGSKKDKDSMTEVERMLDMMKQQNDIQNYQQNYYKAKQQYYGNKGEIQGVISAMQREQSAIKEQNKTLDSNIKKIEQQIAVKKKELAQLKPTDEKYKEVADDLSKLQKAHQEYTVQVVNNQAAIVELTQAIKEQQDKIRDMEIEIENLVLQAIEDRENKKQNMLKAEVDLENKIFDIIKKRYETERDETIDVTQLRIETLEKERDLLSEQLNLRKQQAEQEDKQKRLMELELQYQRISADPTRAKEALKIQNEIADLREEMAWDAAEEEVKAQQDAIDQQIDSLEDYIEYVNNYYDELFEHPKQLIQEMRDVMEMSDDEIIEWLKKNDEEYENASERRQEQIIDGWNETLDSIAGRIQTHWAEVQDIISRGDSYIIKFLKDNSAEYAAASKLQAQKFVDEWKTKLAELKKAHKQAATDIAAMYQVISPYSGSGSSSGGGGGGGGSTTYGGGTTVKNSSPYSVYGKTPQGNASKLSPTYSSYASAKEAAIKAIQNGWSSVYISSKGGTSKVVSSVKGDFGPAFKEGGILDFTGPAWIDGSKQKPERVLNPYQNELFETLVRAMERMSKVQIPSMPDFGRIGENGNSVMSIGDIIVNVDNLDTEDDYETIARKVSEIIMERIGRTTVVGGLRINP